MEENNIASKTKDVEIDKKINITEIYTTLTEAKEEIKRRWGDEDLRKKVKKFLGEIPEPFRKEPRAVLARHILTPNREYCYFKDVADMSGLKALGWEYLEDKFYTVNPEKLHLGKLLFFNKDLSISSRKIIDFKEKIEGKELFKVKTIWNESLVDFHHGLFTSLGINDAEKYDGSLFYKSNGNGASENHKFFLALFVQNGILFENYISNEQDNEFTKKVAIPAFNFIKEYFNVKPLIVPLVSRKIECDPQWMCLPAKISDLVEKKLITISK